MTGQHASIGPHQPGDFDFVRRGLCVIVGEMFGRDRDVRYAETAVDILPLRLMACSCNLPRLRCARFRLAKMLPVRDGRRDSETGRRQEKRSNDQQAQKKMRVSGLKSRIVRQCSGGCAI
jgi:hypothetical protein